MRQSKRLPAKGKQDEVISLVTVKTPMLRVEIAEGEIKMYDPFEIVRKVEPMIAQLETLDLKQTLPSVIFDRLKEVFGLKNVTDYQILYLVQKVIEMTASALDAKKA